MILSTISSKYSCLTVPKRRLMSRSMYPEIIWHFTKLGFEKQFPITISSLIGYEYCVDSELFEDINTRYIIPSSSSCSWSFETMIAGCGLNVPSGNKKLTSAILFDDKSYVTGYKI